MKERPIIFSGPMVRAILDERKSQTRRVVKNLDYIQDWDKNDKSYGPFYEDEYGDWHKTAEICPYGTIGDHLWVRETFAYMVEEHDEYPFDIHGIAYRATNPEACPEKWTPSIFMPRWASRINLEITNVRVERLQAMSYYDWISDFCPNAIDQQSALASFIGKRHQIDMSKKFWDSINGKKYPWDSNPWVWILEFKRLEPSLVAREMKC